MTSKAKTKQLKPYQGVIVFILVILFIIFIATPIQLAWGLYGVAVTEVIILLFAIIPAIILKTNLREMFPIRRPLLRHIFGVIFIWIATYLLVTIISLITMYFFPEGIIEVSDGLGDIITSAPMGIALLIIALMPAICEEALHRGFILYSFKTVDSKWKRILYMGIVFGIFHLDPYRFLPTAILGMAMTYIMIETNNIIMPIFLHFINNGLTTIASFTSETNVSQSTDFSSEMILNSIGSFIIIGGIVPFLYLIGSRLLHKKELGETKDLIIKKKRRKTLIVASACSISMVLLGLGIIAKGIIKSPVFETSISMKVNYKTDKLQFPMEIDKSGDYLIDLWIEAERGQVIMDIIDEKGAVIYHIPCQHITLTSPITLEKATYRVDLEFLMEPSAVKEYYKTDIEFLEKFIADLNFAEDLDELSAFDMKFIIK